jgi:hypothetical protein
VILRDAQLLDAEHQIAPARHIAVRHADYVASSRSSARPVELSVQKKFPSLIS